jgi:hypothetical protein
MLDIPTCLSVSNSAKPRIKDFLSSVQNNFTRRVAHIKEFKDIPDLVPVVTYNPERHYVSTGRHAPIQRQVELLREDFPKLAYRLFVTGFRPALNEVKKVATSGDILLLDIDDTPLDDDDCVAAYGALKSIGKKCQTVLIRSAINDELYNYELPHDKPVKEYDNSLLKKYASLGFNAFGDYAGIKKERRITPGGKGTPGFVFYYWYDNQYIGFRGNDKNLDHYYTVILPSVLKSKYFNAYPAKHKQECPACKTLIELGRHAELFKSHAKWKGLAIMHYLHTLEQFL